MKKPFAISLLLSAVTPAILATAPADETPAASAKHATAEKSTHASSAQEHAASPLKTQRAKQSYAIGVNLGKSFKAQSVEIDPNVLLQGLKDALAERKALLSDEEVRSTLMQLQSNVRTAQMQKMKELAAKNKVAGDAFLAANKAKEGVTTTVSGLQYKILTTGHGPKPQSADTVSVNYKGTLIDGTEFDSSYKRGQAATFPVSQVIKGWTEALQLMPVGSKWQLFIPPALAYGERGNPAIPPNSTLIFDVELLDTKPPAAAQNPTKG